MKLNYVQWKPGDELPRPTSETSHPEKDYARALFKRYLAQWRANNSGIKITHKYRRILKKNARLDAFATFKAMKG